MRVLLAAFLAVLTLTTTAKADPAMWEARDADSRIVLFGSVHALPEELTWRTPALDAAMASSEHVYFETDIGPRGLLALTVKMTVAMFQSTTTPWLHMLSDEDLVRLEIAVAPLGLTLETAGQTPPWLLSMQLAGQQMAEADTSSGEYSFGAGVEWTLQWDLLPDEKAFFETPIEQFEIIAAGTVEEQVEALVATLGESAAGDELDRLVTAWASGDVESLASMVQPKSEAETAVMQSLL
ncbi:MAG: TraB/GumN family protein, partial [Ilumatobacteraceae bacterium]